MNPTSSSSSASSTTSASSTFTTRIITDDNRTKTTTTGETTTTTTATSTRRTTSTTIPIHTDDNNNNHNPCIPCIQLLHDAFTRIDSRPMKLFQSMMVDHHNINNNIILERRNQLYNNQSRRINIDNESSNMSHNNNNNDVVLLRKHETPLLATSNRINHNHKGYDNNYQHPSTIVTWRKTNDGVQVQIPVATTSDTESNNETSSSSSKTTTTTKRTEATSSSSESSSSTSILSSLRHRIVSSSSEHLNYHHPSSKSEEQHNNNMEWLSVSCKMCSDSGPEANARAFVMGPNPLSIVICQNRLHETKPLSKLSQYFTRKISQSTNNVDQNADDYSTTATDQSIIQKKNTDNTRSHNKNHHNTMNSNNTKRSINYINTLEQRNEVDEILTHELIHVYDIRQLQFDLRDCQNLAYSEVRAAREAECSKYHTQYNNLYNQQQQQYNHNQHQQQDSNASPPSDSTTSSSSTWSSSISSLFPTRNNESKTTIGMRCVRQKASMATNNLFPITGKSCVDSIFHKAYYDIRPHHNYNQQTNTSNDMYHTGSVSSDR